MAFPSFNRVRPHPNNTYGLMLEPFSQGTVFQRDRILVCIVATNSNPTLTVVVASQGWTKLGQATYSTTVTLGVFYKKATGYGKDNLWVSANKNVYFSSLTYVIDSGDTVDASSATGSSSSPDSPNHIPSGGSDDYFWLSAVAILGAQTTQTPPTNFSNKQFVERWNPNGSNLIVAERQYTGSSLNPGAWSVTSSADWVAYTIAISPGTMGTNDYGMKCWDASGNLRIDSTERITGLVYETTATADNDGNSGSLSEIAGRETLEIGIAKEAGGLTTEQAPHHVYRSANTIYWDARENSSYNSVDTCVLVFVYE